MTLEAQNICRLQQVGVVIRSVNIMATETAHAVRVHRALHEIVALHPILVRRTVGKMSESLFAQLVLFQLPEILEIQPDLESNRPVVVFTIDGIVPRLSLRVTLNTYVRRLN